MGSSTATKRWRENNPDKVREWVVKNREKINANARKRRAADPEKFRAAKRKYYRKNRKHILELERQSRYEVIKRYGGKCICCGETELAFLALDHIDGGGRQHRKQIKVKIYQWAKDNNYPDILQVLCHNCNQAKHIYGECPHQKQTRNKNDGVCI